MDQLIFILSIVLPAGSFLLTSLPGKLLHSRLAGILSSTLLFASFIFSSVAAFQYFSYEKSSEDFRELIVFSETWLKFSEDLSVDISIIANPLSVMMTWVVTFISFLVHLFSLSYLEGEIRFRQYFSYLGLFTFSMLGLVISGNIIQMYMFWELVGLSSFLLIGFYFTKDTAVAAAKKAFIVTRFADLGFLTGILILGFYAETFDFRLMIERLSVAGSTYLENASNEGFAGVSALSWGLVLVFIGGAGKSAMFPLHIWLPDAMEGPTPVSALIHAATMVVAGVYLVARLFVVYASSCPAAMEMITWVGSFTALFAAIIACTQSDLKRILAFSTMSQIAFMMVSLGAAGMNENLISGYTAGLFHLFTHAMFKAMLFLAAGVIIHSLHTNNIFEMGGLRKKLPFIHFAFLTGCLAISGIPPFAGFFSKETVLSSLEFSNHTAYVLSVITSALTAFYMFRLYFIVFHHRKPENGHYHAGSLLSVPVAVLAIATVTAGFFPFEKFITAYPTDLSFEIHFSDAILPVSLSVLSIITAWIFYYRKNALAENITMRVPFIHDLIRNKFYVDQIYLAVTKSFIFRIIGGLSVFIEKYIIGNIIRLTTMATEVFSETISGIQSGKLQNYSAWLFAGILSVIIIFFMIWM